MPSNFRAVLIGINYYGTPNQLSGCINDVKLVANFLQNDMGFLPSEMTILTDDQAKTSNLYPSRANMISAFTSAVAAIQNPGDVLVIHYSGHGSQSRQSAEERKLGYEDDGMDETLCPADFDTAGMITDFDLRSMIVNPLPAGSICRVLFDQCHSATALDLRYFYEPSTTMAVGNGVKESKNMHIPLSKADIKSLSGCHDNQTSADAFINRKADGALTFALIDTLKTIGVNESCGTMLNAVNHYMIKNHYTQRPVLASGLNEDVASTPFFFKLNR